MLATTLPYLAGFARQGAEWRFTGFVFGAADNNSYIAKMLSGMAGDWLFRTPYTAYPQRGVVAFSAYLLLGKLAAPPAVHEQLVALYHLFRLAAGFLAILATYDFIALFVRETHWRRWGLTLAVLGHGLGWLLVLVGAADWLGSFPLDFYSPETFGFLEIYGLPHLALARALLLWSLCLYLGNSRRTRAGGLDDRGVGMGVLWLGVGLLMPLSVVIGWAAVGLHLLAWGAWQLWLRQRGRCVSWTAWKHRLRRTTWGVSISAPAVLYFLLMFSFDPVLGGWQSQNLVLSPHPLHYLLAYGAVMPWAALGGLRLVRRHAGRFWLPTAWILALPFLVYAPLNLQRRLAEGVWVAWVALSMAGLEGLHPGRARWGRLALLVCSPSTVIIIALGFQTALHPALPAFRAAGEVAAFEWLAQNASPDEIVLASPETSNALPAWAPLRVLVGHGAESVNLAQLTARIADFYRQGADDPAGRSLLEEFDVAYLFYGPLEREWLESLGATPPRWPEGGDWQLVYARGDYRIYRLVRQP